MLSRHLKTEMTTNTESIFYLAAVQWQDQKPSLEFRFQGTEPPEFKGANELELRFRIVAEGTRRCIGTVEPQYGDSARPAKFWPILNVV